MSPLLLLIVAVIYVVVAVNYANNRQWGMCLAFVAYAISNVGFILDALNRK